MAPRPGDHDYPPPPYYPSSTTYSAPATTTPPYWNGPAIGGYTWGPYKSKTYSPGEDTPDTTFYLVGPDGFTSATFLGWAPPVTTTPTQPMAEYTPSSSASISTRKPWRDGDRNNNYPPPQHTNTAVSAAAGAITALLVVGMAMLCCFFFWRRKKKQRRQEAVQMAERSDGDSAFSQNRRIKTISAHIANPADTRSYMRPPQVPPPAMLASPASASSGSVPSTSHAEQPVILSRTMDQSYYTGIDTSDGISISDNRSHLSSVGYADSQDEPPPPYRPASVPPISRDNSIRVSNGITLDRNLRNSVRSNVIRSPFDDPEEEVSDIEEEPHHSSIPSLSTPPSAVSRSSRPRNPTSTDNLSEVSDLEYQREETRPHSNL